MKSCVSWIQVFRIDFRIKFFSQGLGISHAIMICGFRIKVLACDISWVYKLTSTQFNNVGNNIVKRVAGWTEKYNPGSSAPASVSWSEHNSCVSKITESPQTCILWMFDNYLLRPLIIIDSKKRGFHLSSNKSFQYHLSSMILRNDLTFGLAT